MKKTKLFTMLFFVALFALQGMAQDKKFKRTVKINGRMQYDFEFLKLDTADNWFNGNEFRRVHLSAAGKIAPKLKYKVEINFAHAAIGFRDVYLKYTGGKLGNFAFGSMAEPTGLDMATSSKYIPFFERAMLTSMQNFRWGAGFHYDNFKILDGKIGFQLAVTNNGSNDEGFVDKSLEKGSNIVARLTGTPLRNDETHTLVHLGVNFAKRPHKELKFRAENHMGHKYHYATPDGGDRTELGFELGSTFGAISVQGEYKTQTTDHKDKNFETGSYYAMASYFITGEHRPYKNGGFGRVKPENDISNGGFGAIEVLVRYSNMSASDNIIAASVNQPNDVNNLTFGLNWYLTSHARVMYNYTATTDKYDLADVDVPHAGHLVRIQMDF